MELRRTQSAPSFAPRYTIGCMGDSLTYNYTLGVQAYEFWTCVLQSLLQANRYAVRVRNWGWSGNTTGPYTGSNAFADMLTRFSLMTTFDVPDIAIIFAGTNDPAHSIPASVSSTTQAGATQTSIPVQTGAGASFHVDQAVIIGGVQTVITAISTDTLTVNALLIAPGAGVPVTQGTVPNMTYMLNQLKAAGTKKAIIVSQHYLNHTTGGDTLSVPYSGYATIRANQAAVVAAFAGDPNLSVVYCDLYAYMRALIGSTFTMGGVTYRFTDQADSSPSTTTTLGTPSFSWHVKDQNTHMNALGNAIVAQAIYTTLAAQSGWLAALQA